MQRLAGFQQRAWRCESPSSPHASLQRQHTDLHTHLFHARTQTHTHAHMHKCTRSLLLPSVNPRYQRNPLSGLRCCDRAKQARSLVPSPRHAVPNRVWGCVTAACTPASTVQSSSSMKADHLTKNKKKLPDVDAGSQTPAKPFIPKPMWMGQTFSLLWFYNHLRRFSHA